MRLLRACFSLDGRLDRRRYIAAMVLVLAAPIAAVVLMSMAALLILRADLLGELRPVGPAILLLAKLWPLLLLSVFLWTLMAVGAKRVRDIGWPAVPTVALVTGLPVLLVNLHGGGQGLQLLAAVLLWACIGFHLALMAWPGSPRADPRVEAFA